MTLIHIAIDGPAASCKGTAARQLSEKLGIPYLDTGAMYRGVAIFVRDNGIENIEKMKMEIKLDNKGTHIFLNDKDVTSKLRENDVSRYASLVATIPIVRAKMVAMQQEIAKKQSIILEGRDIGNVVLPNAKYKFLLTADVETRAKRRLSELHREGQKITLSEMIEQVKFRDKNDAEKGGFKPVSDAVTIDSSKLSIDEVVHQMYSMIQK